MSPTSSSAASLSPGGTPPNIDCTSAASSAAVAASRAMGPHGLRCRQAWWGSGGEREREEWARPGWQCSAVRVGSSAGLLDLENAAASQQPSTHATTPSSSTAGSVASASSFLLLVLLLALLLVLLLGAAAGCCCWVLL